MTIVVVVALSAGILWALRRWFDPVPPRAGLAFLALALTMVGGGLLPNRVLLPTSSLIQHVPFERLPKPERAANPLQGDLVLRVGPAVSAVRATLLRGEWPLWNPAVGAGESLLGNAQAQPFQPLWILSLLVPKTASFGLVATLRVFLALVFTFAAFRKLGLAEAPALLGAVSFGLGGFVVLWLGWPLANSAAGLPLLVYALLRASRSGLRKDYLLLSAASYFLATGGDRETAQYAALFAGAMAVGELRAFPAARRASIAASWLLAAAAGLCLAAPVLGARSQAEEASATTRNIRARVEAGDGADPVGLSALGKARGGEAWRAAALSRLLPSVAPDALGNSRTGHYWGASNSNEDGSGFPGSIALAFGGLGLATALRRRQGHDRLFAFAAITVLLVLLRPPLLVALTEHLPWLGPSATLHQRSYLLLAFSFSYLAANSFAAQRLRNSHSRASALIAIGVVGALVAWSYAHHRDPSGSGALDALRFRSLAVQLGALGGTAGLLLFARRRPALASTGILLIATCELLSFHLPVNRTSPAATFYPAAPAINFLRAEAAREPGYRVSGLGAAMPAEIAAHYGLEDARYQGSDHPAGILDLTRGLSSSAATPGDLAVANHPVLDLLGVRFLLAPVSANAGDLRTPFRGRGIRVYRRTTALPRLFLPAAAIEWDPRQTDWRDWVASAGDFRMLSLVRDEADRPAAWRATAPAELRDVTAPGPNRLRAELQSQESSLLASSILQDGGWTVLLDGIPKPWTVANGPLLAAWVPSGRSRLDLVYRPVGFLVANLLSALAIAGWAATWPRIKDP